MQIIIDTFEIYKKQKKKRFNNKKRKRLVIMNKKRKHSLKFVLERESFFKRNYIAAKENVKNIANQNYENISATERHR